VMAATRCGLHEISKKSVFYTRTLRQKTDF
jgi:hypothetical protein